METETSRARTFSGEPLTPGVNLDHVDIDAGLREAAAAGFGDTTALMVTTYALQRHQRGEEAGAERTWLSYYPTDLTSWRRILAAAVASGGERSARGGQ
jgi:hypothetical protein